MLSNQEIAIHDTEAGWAATVEGALKVGAEVRPKVGGFPYLAEALRRAGVQSIACTLPGMQTIYRLEQGAVVHQGTPLLAPDDRLRHVPRFDEERLVAAIRADQAGEITFWPGFVTGAWEAGVIAYDVDLDARACTYRGLRGETYREDYRSVDLPVTG